MRKHYQTVSFDELWESAVSKYELDESERARRRTLQTGAVVLAAAVVFGATYEAGLFDGLKAELQQEVPGGGQPR